MTSTLLDTPWKVDHLGAIQWILRPGGNPVDPEKEKKQYSDHLGAKKNQMMSRQSPSKLWLASDNDKEKTSWV
jgi:hypothetical protein